RGKKIEGIRFAADTSGGGRALVIRNKLAPTAPMSVEFTLTPDQKAMKSLYILHTLSDAIKPECAAMCRVIFIDKKGAQTKRDIHIGRDIFTPDQTPRGMNAICVKAEGGNLCFSRFDLPQGTEKIAFAGFYKSPWIIYAATLSDSDVPAFETFRPTPGKWTSAGVDGGFYEIKSGSALDLSGILQTPVPAGSTGRAIVSPRGTIAFESAPDVDVRFKSYSLWDSKLFIYLPPEERKARIREYAAYVRLQGYNLVRIKLDYLKCHDELPRRAEYFDMADFMLSEFRKNGVYYQLIFGTYDDGRPGYKFGLHNEIKMLAMIGDKETWDRWKEGALSFLNHVNPYTGAAWKDDPALLSVEYYNELTNSLGRLYQLEKSVRDRALAKFVEYLKGKYANIGELNAAWNCFKLSDKKYAFKSFDEIPGEKLDRRNNDWLLFAWENICKFGEFAESVVRGAGYKGIVSECNTAGSFAGRSYANRFTDVSIVNTYFSHPSSFMPRAVSCGQNSAIGSDWATNGIASIKLANRPASITEYNFCYWNKYRYEACVLVSPYCALQNFSVMTIHQDVVTQLKFRKGVGARPGLGTFSVGPSPVMRASELLMSCFFIRGDVKPSPHRVDLSVPDGFLKKPEAARSPHPEQARISALTGFAMKFSKMDNTPFAKTVRIKPADVEISPQGSANIRMEAWFQEVEKGEGSFDLEKFVSVLREKKILPEGNKTDVKNGIYQSDTGQITRDMKNLAMKVVTEKSVAVAMEKSQKTELGALTVESTSVPATVGVCSLDGEKISDSKRLVFVYATREANSDMVTSFDNTYAIFIGSKDVMLENGVVKAKLKLRADREYEVYPLSLDGTRREKLGLKVKDGVMEIEIDNSKLPGGLSTTMFEIAAK
ncbi:MAG: hypothetical protein IJI37_05315, partial [Opitutales bacterium]|nr:hypothetical protein [Opitutales bacterium]